MERGMREGEGSSSAVQQPSSLTQQQSGTLWRTCVQMKATLFQSEPIMGVDLYLTGHIEFGEKHS